MIGGYFLTLDKAPAEDIVQLSVFSQAEQRSSVIQIDFDFVKLVECPLKWNPGVSQRLTLPSVCWCDNTFHTVMCARKRENSHSMYIHHESWIQRFPGNLISLLPRLRQCFCEANTCSGSVVVHGGIIHPGFQTVSFCLCLILIYSKPILLFMWGAGKW